MKRNKVFLQLGGVAVVAGSSIATLSCGNSEMTNTLKILTGSKHGGIITGMSTTADQMIGMGLKPDIIANGGMEEKTPYLNKYKIGTCDYINPWANLDIQKLNALASHADTWFGSVDNAGHFKKIFKNVLVNPSTPSEFKGSNAEELTFKLSNKKKENNFSGSKTFKLSNFYSTWEESANMFDKLFNYDKATKTINHIYLNNIKNIENKIKTRISNIREELKKVNKNKSLLIYQWGGKTAPGASVKTDFNDNTWYQSPITPVGPLGSLIYSKKNGLGFELPKFDETKGLVIGQYGYTIKGTANGAKQIRDALLHQNEYVIFDKIKYNSETSLSYNDVKNSFKNFVRGSGKIEDHLFWMKNSSMTNASYGPLGVSYILDFIVNKFGLRKELLNRDFSIDLK